MKIMDNKLKAITSAAEELLNGKDRLAAQIIREKYAFSPIVPETRSYTDRQKFTQFVKDGFIDRYSGQKLINPGLLRVLSAYMPDEFPFQKNWKMSECHMAYWEFVPTVDHIVPIAMGGADDESNWATTSMMHNHIKSNWTLEQMNWKLCPAGQPEDWDGLTSMFVRLIEADESLLKDNYIKNWYRLAKGITK